MGRGLGHRPGLTTAAGTAYQLGAISLLPPSLYPLLLGLFIT